MKNKKGFTLVELIAIIIIVGIIIGIIAPTAMKLIEKSKVNSFREGLRSIIRSAEIYMEENDLKTLPDEGIYLQDNEINVDYADGYSGLIKYINGEVVLQNIGNGTYCGNGSKDTLSVSGFTDDCIVIKPEIQCFIMGTTDTAGDTITGFDLNNAKCNPTKIVIPATVNNVPVKYIAGGAFLEPYEYVVGMGFYDTTPIGGPGMVPVFDLISNLKYMSITPLTKMYFSSLPAISKFCMTSGGQYATVSSGYEMSSTNEYVFCNTPFFSDPTVYMVKGIGVASVDFSNAINLIEIGDNAFLYNYLTGSLDLRGAVNLTKIDYAAFAYNNLETVLFPSKLTNIGNYSFGSNILTNITLPSSITSIGDSAFMQNGLSSIRIPAFVTSIGAFAFGFNHFYSNGCGVVYQGVTIDGDASRFTNDNLFFAQLMPCLN